MNSHLIKCQLPCWASVLSVFTLWLHYKLNEYILSALAKNFNFTMCQTVSFLSLLVSVELHLYWGKVTLLLNLASHWMLASMVSLACVDLSISFACISVIPSLAWLSWLFLTQIKSCLSSATDVKLPFLTVGFLTAAALEVPCAQWSYSKKCPFILSYLPPKNCLLVPILFSIHLFSLS